MQLTNNQYNEMVSKIAGEIVDGEIESYAGVGAVAGRAKEVMSGSKWKGAYKAAKGMADNPEAAQHVKDAFKSERLKTLAARAGAGAVGAGAAGGAGYAGYKATHKEAEEAYIQNVLEKAASVWQNAEAKEAEAMEALAYAEALQEEAYEVLAGCYAEKDAVEKVAYELDLI